MTKIIDTEGKIISGDGRPQLKIGDKLYTVDDRRSTWKKIQKLQEDSSVAEPDEEIIRLALGKKAANELLNDDSLTFSGFNELTFYIMAAITGEDYEDLKKEARERKN